MRLSVIIPVYNEENTVTEVLAKVAAVEIEKEIIVVDDASSDSTVEKIHSLTIPGLRLIEMKKNGGKASAVREGIKEARGEYVIIQDADLEYDPADIIGLAEKAAASPGAAVYGDRFERAAKSMFLKQYLANRFLSVLTGLLYRSRISDMETCYKLIPRETLLSLSLREERFDIEAELTAKLLRRGIKIEEVPISYHGRSYSEGKKIGFRDFLTALRTLFKFRLVGIE